MPYSHGCVLRRQWPTPWEYTYHRVQRPLSTITRICPGLRLGPRPMHNVLAPTLTLHPQTVTTRSAHTWPKVWGTLRLGPPGVEGKIQTHHGEGLVRAASGWLSSRVGDVGSSPSSVSSTALRPLLRHFFFLGGVSRVSSFKAWEPKKRPREPKYIDGNLRHHTRKALWL